MACPQTDSTEFAISGGCTSLLSSTNWLMLVSTPADQVLLLRIVPTKMGKFLSAEIFSRLVKSASMHHPLSMDHPRICLDQGTRESHRECCMLGILPWQKKATVDKAAPCGLQCITLSNKNTGL